MVHGNTIANTVKNVSFKVDLVFLKKIFSQMQHQQIATRGNTNHQLSFPFFQESMCFRDYQQIILISLQIMKQPHRHDWIITIPRQIYFLWKSHFFAFFSVSVLVLYWQVISMIYLNVFVNKLSFLLHSPMLRQTDLTNVIQREWISRDIKTKKCKSLS